MSIRSRLSLGRLAIAGPIVAMALGLSFSAHGFEREEIVCKVDDLTRLISLRVDPEAGYVCDVLYEKPDEGDTREVLWSARNDVEYCRPRFVGLVEQLDARGWSCDYADEPVDSAEQPAIAAATSERQDDDEDLSEGAAGKFRDWCVADVASDGNAQGEGSVKSYCNCVAGGMGGHGLTEEDADLIFNGLSSVVTDDGSDALTDKRLNTLAENYASVVEFCS